MAVCIIRAPTPGPSRSEHHDKGPFSWSLQQPGGCLITSFGKVEKCYVYWNAQGWRCSGFCRKHNNLGNSNGVQYSTIYMYMHDHTVRTTRCRRCMLRNKNVVTRCAEIIKIRVFVVYARVHLCSWRVVVEWLSRPTTWNLCHSLRCAAFPANMCFLTTQRRKQG